MGMLRSNQPDAMLEVAIDDTIIRHVLADYPDAQAIYLFGSRDTDEAWTGCDIEVALLLPHDEAWLAGQLTWSDLQARLAVALEREVDLLNARLVTTVLQKAIIFGERIYCADRNATDEFEAVTLSLYQKLNEERAAIVDAVVASGRAYAV